MDTSSSKLDFNAAVWFLDSGATYHMTPCKALLSNFEEITPFPIFATAADQQPLFATGKGQATLDTKFRDKILSRKIKEAYYVPGLVANLLSTTKLWKSGFSISIDARGCLIRDCERKIVAAGTHHEGLTELRNVEPPGHVFLTTEEIWHQRLGHPSDKRLEQASHTSNGIPKLANVHVSCTICSEGKQKRKAISKGPAEEPEFPLQIVHSDLAGPSKVASIGGSYYISGFVDAKTRHTWVYFLKTKDENPETIDGYITTMNNHSGETVKTLFTDNGPEFTGKLTQKVLAKHGVIHKTTPPNTPEYNSIIEKRFHLIFQIARTLLHQSGLPQKFWAEAIRLATYIVNRMPTSILGHSPYEAWTGHPPDVSNLHIFGAKGQVLVEGKHLSKFDKRTVEMVYLGPAISNNGHRMWNPITSRIIESRNVKFFEDHISNDIVTLPNISILEQDRVENIPAPQPQLVPDENESPIDISAIFDPPTPQDKPINELDQPDNNLPVNIPDEEEQQEEQQPAPQHVPQIPPPPPPPIRQSSRGLIPNRTLNSGQYVLLAEGDPNSPTYQQALCSSEYPHWKSAMEKELGSFNTLNTWKLVNPPLDALIIGTKWVLRKKIDSDGKVIYKARLVAQGYTQQKGVDFHETYAPVARMTSMRLICAISAHLGLELEQIDVESAYLHGKIDSVVYLCQPPGFVDPNQPKSAYLLHGNLYGLKQAAKIWNEKIHHAFLALGLKQTTVDPCIYISISKQGILIVGLHVDDCLVAGEAYLIQEFKSNLHQHFPIKELGFPRTILGIQIERGADSITLHQSIYLQKLVEDTGMDGSSHVHTPLIIPTQPDPLSPPLNEKEKGEYLAILGRIMYAMVSTRPDLAFATGYLGRFSAAPTQEHWVMMKRLLRYINGRQQNSITYKKGKGKVSLVGFADADWGGAEDRKSTTGYIFTLNGAPISWSSKKQQTVALSSTEAEYVALTHTTKEAIWLRALLKDLGQEQTEATIINEDNRSVISLALNPVNHQRTKHIDIQYHFIRDKIQHKQISLQHTPTEAQLADGMTKALGRNLFSHFFNRILSCIPSSV